MLSDDQIRQWVERATSLVCAGLDGFSAERLAARQLGIDLTDEALEQLYEWEARCSGAH